MEDKTLIAIEMIDNVKYIHYLGYCYTNDEGLHDWLEYTFLFSTLEEAVNYGISKWETDNQEFVKQYITVMSEAEFEDLANNFPVIKEADINLDTPCGTYFVNTEAIE